MPGIGKIAGLVIGVLFVGVQGLLAAPNFRAFSAETRLPLAGVTVVSYPGSEILGATDDEGMFSISQNNSAGSAAADSVVFTCVGYNPSTWIAGANSQTDPIPVYLKPTTLTLDRIVVTGSRSPHLLEESPVQTEVITAEQIQESGATNLAEALRFNSGVTVSDDFSGQGISIRGIDPTRVLVLVDGERAIGRVGGSIDLSQFSVQNIRRIEIVKGAGSTLYGSDALGGTVNIITGSSEGDLLQGAMSVGSYNSTDPFVRFAKKLENAQWRVDGSFHSNEAIDLDPSTKHTNGRDGVDRFDVSAEYSRTIKKLKFKSRAAFMHEERNWIESRLYPGIGEIAYDDLENNMRLTGALSANYFASPELQFESSVSVAFYDHSWEKYTRTGILNDSSISDENAFHADALARRMFGKNILTTGIEFRREQLNSESLADGSESISQFGIFTQYEVTLPGDILALPGVRVESNQRFGEFVSPSVSLMRDLSKRYRLRAFIGRGFRAPSIKEMFYEFNHSSEGYLVIGNSNLEPETSLNTALTLEISQGRSAEYRITAFYNLLNEMIEFDSVSNTPEFPIGIYQYSNIHSARTRGFEFEARWRLSAMTSISASYDFLDAKDLTSGEALPNRAKHSGAVMVACTQLPILKLSGAIWGEFEAEKNVLDRFEVDASRSETGMQQSAPFYAPIGMRLSRDIGRGFTLSGKIENIFDETDYRLGRNNPRSISVRLSLNAD